MTKHHTTAQKLMTKLLNLDCNNYPLWINKGIKEWIHGKNHANKSYRQNKNETFYPWLVRISSIYYYTRVSKKLSNPITSSKSYCFILKAFLNNKEIHCIPPLLNDVKFITNLEEKTEIFNNSDLNSVLSKKT